jgi:hypothetical protein
MKKSNRILILAIVVEALLAAITVVLVLQVRSGAIGTVVSPEETIGRIGTAIGAAMGTLGVFFALLALHLRKQGD